MTGIITPAATKHWMCWLDASGHDMTAKKGLGAGFASGCGADAVRRSNFKEDGGDISHPACIGFYWVWIELLFAQSGLQ